MSLALSRVKGSASHCPIEERYPKADEEAEITISAFHGALSELPCAYYTGPPPGSQKLSWGVCVYICVCVCFLIEKRWKLGYIKDVCFGAQSGSFNEGRDVSLPTPINQPGWTSPLICFSDDTMKEGH